MAKKIIAPKSNRRFIIFATAVFLTAVFFTCSFMFSGRYSLEFFERTALSSVSSSTPDASLKHVPMPDSVKAVYMTSWVAGTPKIRRNMVAMIERTELNSIVIDIKDYSGRISFVPDDPYLLEIGSGERRIADIESFIKELHGKGIYVIGRISVFQDPYLVSKRPDLAVKTFSDKSRVWRDKKGLSWIDPGAREAWEYAARIGEYAHSIGFDELNFDYIRFPSDGNMEDIYYPFSEGKDKVEVMTSFFAYIHKKFRDSGAHISADVFGMTTTNDDDLNIGQKLQKATAYFDFACPMVYPSHYPPGFLNLRNPAANPYEVVKFSMDEGLKRGALRERMRPWLQDFDLGADYDANMVRAQIQAVYDAGIKSWMIWSPSNVYSEGAFEKASE